MFRAGRMRSYTPANQTGGNNHGQLSCTSDANSERHDAEENPLQACNCQERKKGCTARRGYLRHNESHALPLRFGTNMLRAIIIRTGNTLIAPISSSRKSSGAAIFATSSSVIRIRTYRE